MKRVWPYVVISIASLLVVAQPLTVLAVSGGSIGGRPASPDPSNPRTNSIFIHEISGGASKKDQILIKNSSDRDEVVSVYAVDGVVTQTGDLTCRQRVEPQEDVGKWVQLAKTQLSLGANSEERVDFEITVPASADVGEHNGCIVIQREEPEATNQGSGVQLQTRQAVRVAVLIPGDIKREVSIDQFNVVREGDLQKYQVGIKNVGNVSADVNIKLVVKSASGKVVYENGGEYAAVANEVRTFTYESSLRPFLGGTYTADLEISYDKRAGSWGTQDASQLITKKAEQKKMFFWPSTTAWLSLAGILLAIALFVVARRNVSISFKRPAATSKRR